jgi:hypothetical protein
MYNTILVGITTFSNVTCITQYVNIWLFFVMFRVYFALHVIRFVTCSISYGLWPHVIGLKWTKKMNEWSSPAFYYFVPRRDGSMAYAQHCTEIGITLFSSRQKAAKRETTSPLPRGKYWHCCIGRLEYLDLPLFTITEITSDLSQKTLLSQR